MRMRFCVGGMRPVSGPPRQRRIATGSPPDHDDLARKSVRPHRRRRMTDRKALESRFWKHLNDDRTVMLGSAGIAPRPMTAIAENDRAPLWFFTAADTDLGKVADASHPADALASFASKDHDLFATVSGPLVLDNDR